MGHPNPHTALHLNLNPPMDHLRNLHTEHHKNLRNLSNNHPTNPSHSPMLRINPLSHSLNLRTILHQSPPIVLLPSLLTALRHRINLRLLNLLINLPLPRSRRNLHTMLQNLLLRNQHTMHLKSLLIMPLSQVPPNLHTTHHKSRITMHLNPRNPHTTLPRSLLIMHPSLVPQNHPIMYHKNQLTMLPNQPTMHLNQLLHHHTALQLDTTTSQRRDHRNKPIEANKDLVNPYRLDVQTTRDQSGPPSTLQNQAPNTPVKELNWTMEDGKPLTLMIVYPGNPLRSM